MLKNIVFYRINGILLFLYHPVSQRTDLKFTLVQNIINIRLDTIIEVNQLKPENQMAIIRDGIFHDP